MLGGVDGQAVQVERPGLEDVVDPHDNDADEERVDEQVPVVPDVLREVVPHDAAPALLEREEGAVEHVPHLGVGPARGAHGAVAQLLAGRVQVPGLFPVVVAAHEPALGELGAGLGDGIPQVPLGRHIEAHEEQTVVVAVAVVERVVVQLPSFFASCADTLTKLHVVSVMSIQKEHVNQIQIQRDEVSIYPRMRK